jgi:adenine-specific DNA-methyltransferase
MNRRLKLAKKLLCNSGIIICTIDEYENGNLSLLLNRIFGEENKLGCISITHNPRGRSDDKFFATCNEYVYIFAKNKNLAKTYNIPLSEEQRELFQFEDDISSYRLLPFKRTGSNSTPNERPLLYYPIFYNKITNDVSLNKKSGYIEILPLDNDKEKRVWRWGKDTFLEKYKTEIYFKIDNDRVNIFTKDRIKEGRKPKTVWEQAKYDASSHGTMLLKKILGNDVNFDYPKSLYAVMDMLKITGNKNALILDFFAGSGTTGHAVLELNKEDSGNRQFILCTNNENNICEEVTYPRIKKVIEGYADKVGISANVKYFKQTFVPNIANDQDKRELVNRSTELLCMAENTFENIVKRNSKSEFAIFKNATKQIAIIYDEESIKKCVSKLNSINFPFETVIYVFSYDHTYDENDFVNLKMSFSVKPIPEAILNVYRKIAKMRKK